MPRLAEVMVNQLRLGTVIFANGFARSDEPGAQCAHCGCARTAGHILLECPLHAVPLPSSFWLRSVTRASSASIGRKK